MAAANEEQMLSHRKQFVGYAAAFQFALALIFAVSTKYGDSANAATGIIVNGTLQNSVQSEVDHYYPFYQDVHVMIFIGFGFLMTFLKKYTFSSVGLNFIIAAFAIQWSMIVNGVIHNIYEGHASQKISLGITNLITSDFAAGAVLVSFGAVLGKTTPLQMLIVVIFELLVYACNELIGAVILGAVDMGGSIFVHTFGAYFGLALSRTISRSKLNKDGSVKDHPLNGSNYTSDTFAMVGTIFLWMYWPSFNGALAEESQQHRVIINTVLALCSCCITAFFMDALLREGNKFDMVSIQNATLAGGVAVGSSSDLVIEPYGAILIGIAAGVLSVIGYVYVQPKLARIWGIDDTCGVHNLHGMPGILGAVMGGISAGQASENLYGQSIATVFPNRDPAGKAYTAGEQAGVQFAALGITLCFAIVGGILTGLIIKMPCFLPPEAKKSGCCTIGESNNRGYWYKDEHYWEVPEDEEDEEDAVDKDQILLELGLLNSSIESANARKQELEQALDTDVAIVNDAGEPVNDSNEGAPSPATKKEE